MAPLRSAKLNNNISDELKNIIDADFDKASARRRAREGFKHVQFSINHCLFKVHTQGLKIDENYEKNSRGVEIFSKSWLPESHPPKAMICFCHGYGESCGFFFEEKPELHDLPSFLLGQSMGGAVALKTAYNIIAYKDKPRLKTAVELLNITDELERQLHEVCLPLLILHGEADKVTDPSVSKTLFEKASNKDKKLNLYKDACHQLLEGEPDDVIFGIFDDIISWLDERSSKAHL
ncbi:Caffeoylshikimate esterase [Bienertia sinuspersici]